MSEKMREEIGAMDRDELDDVLRAVVARQTEITEGRFRNPAEAVADAED
jgi:hypothetical protein